MYRIYNSVAHKYIITPNNIFISLNQAYILKEIMSWRNALNDCSNKFLIIIIILNVS